MPVINAEVPRAFWTKQDKDGHADPAKIHYIYKTGSGGRDVRITARRGTKLYDMLLLDLRAQGYNGPKEGEEDEAWETPEAGIKS